MGSSISLRAACDPSANDQRGDSCSFFGARTATRVRVGSACIRDWLHFASELLRPRLLAAPLDRCLELGHRLCSLSTALFHTDLDFRVKHALYSCKSLSST